MSGKEDLSVLVVSVAAGVVIGGVIAVPLFAYIFPSIGITFETNGQIGDFVGGILNPIIAFLAFIWLRRGVTMQKEELQETRVSLSATAESMKKQELNSGIMVRISALNALISSIMQEVVDIRSQIDYYAAALGDKVAYDLDGFPMNGAQLTSKLSSLKEKMESRIAERDAYEREIRALSVLPINGSVGG